MNTPIQPGENDTVDQGVNKSAPELAAATQTASIRPVQLDRKQVESEAPLDQDLDDPCSP